MVFALILSLVFLAPGLAATQPRPTGGYRPLCSHDTSVPPDTGRFTVYLRALDTLPTGAPVPPASRAVAWSYSRAIATAFQAPGQLPVPGPVGLSFGRPGRAPGDSSLPSLTGRLKLSSRRDGPIAVVWDLPSEAESLNAAVARAASRADSAGLLTPAPPGRDAIWIEVRASTAPPDSTFPLLRVRTTYYWVDRPARFLSSSPRLRVVRWPQVGSVVLQYVVGTDGLAIAGSMRAVRASDPELIEAAKEIVVGSRFAPATQGDCKIPQLVDQRISWNRR